MIKIKQLMAGDGAKSAAQYFTNHLSASAYYHNGVGILQGKTFEYLNLSKRDVDEQVFTAIERNLHPETGKKLTPRTRKSQRRTCMDVTLIPSKTLSMVIAENDNEFGLAIEKAVIAAKEKALQFAELLVKVSVSNHVAFDERTTGHALYMSVVHREARASKGHAADPYFHCHNVLFNCTYDPLEKRLRAATMSDVLKFSETIDALFLSDLEGRLTNLGIGTERTADGKGFEVTCVQGREIFCKRTEEIIHDRKAEEKLIDCLARAKVREAAKIGKQVDYTKVRNNIVNARSRQLAKEKIEISADEQLRIWREQMTPEIRASLQREAVLAGQRRNWRTAEEAKEEVVFSAFKQESVVHEYKIVELLLRAAGGSMTFDEALTFAKSEAFIHLDKDGHVTTEAVRQEERQMLATAKWAQDRYASLVKDPQRAIRNERVGDAPDQAAATRFIWNSKDGVMDVSGVAGAGKSTMLKEVIPAIRQEGHKVVILAPTSASEKNLQDDFPEAQTLQQFMVDLERFPGIAEDLVIFLDESSLVSVPQMAKLVELVRTQGCRLITLGDVDQHNSPQRGDAIRILQESKSVRSSELTQTYRAQVAYLKETILDLKAGGVRREIGYDRLDEHGDIREVEDTAGMRDAAVQAHLEAARRGELAILASPTHFEARAAAEMVRNILKAEGKIEAEDHTINRLTRLRVEGKELRDPIHYQPGRVVIFHPKVKGGFYPGEKWQVVGSQADGLITLERQGATKLFNPCSKGDWKIYETAEMALSVGDQVRITEGFRQNNVQFHNNDIRKIAAIYDHVIKLDDGRSMERDFVHLDQGVCITSYAAECRTVKQIVSLTPLSALTALDAKTFYVLASRATHRAIFYTDCKEALKEAALREGDRAAVWDYEKEVEPKPELIDLQQGKKVGKAPPQRNIVGQLQRLIAAGVVRMTQPQQVRGFGYER